MHKYANNIFSLLPTGGVKESYTNKEIYISVTLVLNIAKHNRARSFTY